MTQQEVVGLVTALLERTGVAYMIVGSLASTRYGAPRLTQDADVVVDLDLDQARALVGALEQGFYVSETAAREAVRRRGMFNAVHLG